MVLTFLLGIVSLLFCGITMKHYAYYNMSRRTQLTIKFIFQITAQLSENFIFIYLGLTLFTDQELVYKPLFILITTLGICAARWLSVFPLSKVINYLIRLRAKRLGKEEVDELPFKYQAMLFWAGLRGAVGVALAAGLSGETGRSLRATVLIVVVLTVIIFGGTTARMLEILQIRTGVVEEIDSDDEFDIETTNAGTYYKRGGTAFGHNPKGTGTGIDLEYIPSKHVANGSARPNGRVSRPSKVDRGYSSSNRHSPSSRDRERMSRKNSSVTQRERQEAEQHDNLLSQDHSNIPSDDEDDAVDLDLPPAAPRRKPSPMPPSGGSGEGHLNSSSHLNVTVHGPDAMEENDGDITDAATRQQSFHNSESGPSASGAMGGGVGGIRDLLRGATADHVAWLRQLDEDFIKPKLLLDQGQGHGKGPPPV